MSQNQKLKIFLSTLSKVTDSTIRADMFEIEAIETGGSIQSPEQSGWPSTHVFEISLYDLFMTGTTMREAMMKWERTARRCLLSEAEGVLA